MTFVGDPTLTSDEAQIVYMSGDNLHSINQFCKIELDPFFISKDKIVCVCVCVCVTVPGVLKTELIFKFSRHMVF